MMLNRVGLVMKRQQASLVRLARGNRTPAATSIRFLSASPADASACCDGDEEDCDCFKRFGVRRSFSIPLDELKSTYKKLMTDLHPDRHSLKDPEEQEHLTQQASTVTRCYDVVSHPNSRALYLLDLMGKPMDENDTGALVGTSFLMQIMELREEIDNTSSDKELRRLYNENKDRMDSLYEQLGESFEKNDLDEARRLTAMLQYYNRVEETIRENKNYSSA